MGSYNQGQRKAELTKKNDKTTKIVIIVAVVLFIGFIFLSLVAGAGIILFNEAGGTKNIFGQGQNYGEVGQFNINTGADGQQGEFPSQQDWNQTNTQQTGQYDPQTGTFTANPQGNFPQTQNQQGNFPQTTNQQNFTTAGGMQTVEVFDQNAGCCIFSINLPAGWTHKFQSQWNRNAMPMVMYSFIAESPDKSSTFAVLPSVIYFDSPMSNGKISGFMKPMSPAEYAEYVIGSMTKMSGYENMTYQFIKEYPANSAQQPVIPGATTKVSAFAYDLHVNGKTNTMLLKITVAYMPDKYNQGQSYALNTWGADAIVFTAPKGNPETISQTSTAILNSIKLNPQWQNKVQSTTQAWNLENQKINANQTAQIQAANDYQFKTQQQVFKNRSDAQSRVMNRMTDTVVGRDNRINPYTGEQFKSDTNYNHVWVNSNGETIQTNNTTYNPNYDANRSGDWSQAPEGY